MVPFQLEGDLWQTSAQRKEISGVGRRLATDEYPSAARNGWRAGDAQAGGEAQVRLVAYPAVALCMMANTAPVKRYTMLGHGASSCGQWSTDRTQQGVAANSDRAWLLGYVTAFNRYGPDPRSNVANGVDPEGMVHWIDAYCEKNPTEPIANAADSLITYLRGR